MLNKFCNFNVLIFILLIKYKIKYNQLKIYGLRLIVGSIKFNHGKSKHF